MVWLGVATALVVAGLVYYSRKTSAPGPATAAQSPDWRVFGSTKPAKDIPEGQSSTLREATSVDSLSRRLSGNAPLSSKPSDEPPDGKPVQRALNPVQGNGRLAAPAKAVPTTVSQPEPPRLKPPTFSAMPPPPRPTAGPALRPPPSAASMLRVPPTKVLSNSSMAPSSQTPPSGKQSRMVTLAPGHSPLDWATLTSDPNRKLRGKDVPENLIKVSPSMLKYHNGRKGRDAWTEYQGRVYNITPYLPFHPGGEAELMKGAGRNAAKLFMEVHPWVNWDGMLAACLVGILVAEGEEVEKPGLGANDLEEMD